MPATDFASDVQSIRLRIDLAYDGTFFRGWATQPGLRTCQGEIEKALSVIARQPLAVTVAGRTDAGVHAAHQVLHVDFPRAVWESLLREPRPTPCDLAAQALVRRVNMLLQRSYGEWMAQCGMPAVRGSADLVVRNVSVVNTDFDARFSAVQRAYVYRVGVGLMDPLRRHDVYWVGESPDVGAMVDFVNAAAEPLLGEHDFLSFCKPRQGASTIRTLKRLEAACVDGDVVEFHVEADAFCHSMVRSLVGSLLQAVKIQDVELPARLLLQCSRESAAPIAPAQGLSLVRVDYPHPDQWGVQAGLARRRRDEKPCCGEG